MCLALDAPRSALLTWLVTEIPERFEYHGRVVFYYLVVWKRLETEGSNSLARDWERRAQTSLSGESSKGKGTVPLKSRLAAT